MNASWQVPKDMPVQAEIPREKVEPGSVPKPTVLNTATQNPITIKLAARTVSLRPARGRAQLAAKIVRFISMPLFGF